MYRLPLLQWACPWGVPTAEWDSLAPKIQKCTHCADRSEQPRRLAFNGQALTDQENKRFLQNIVSRLASRRARRTRCYLVTREEILQEARNRISDQPEKYVDHIYGEKEAGGTSCVVPIFGAFRRSSDFPRSATRRIRRFPKWLAIHAVPPAVWPWAQSSAAPTPS